MKIRTIITTCCLSNGIAGALIVIAFMQCVSPTSWIIAGIGLATNAAVTGWASLKFRNGMLQLRSQLENPNSPAPENRIADLKEIGQRFVEVHQTALQVSANDAEELQEIKQLLQQLDRRHADVDRDGKPIRCATQLVSILRGLGSELESSVQQAISCGVEITRASQEIVGGTEQQSDLVDQTTSIIERLSSHVLSVCDNAEIVSTSSSKAKASAQDGLKKFQLLKGGLEQTRDQAAARERKLAALGQHTKEIESIVQSIGTLSSRTDLLALNASIESVRAGEHGRGFAIVADEVRALAEQSAQAVADISRRIELIQLETHQSISGASKEHHEMMALIEQIDESFEALEQICDSATETTVGLTKITDATSQQLLLTQQVVETIERSTETSRKNRSRAEGVNWTAKTLSQLGGQLENGLSFFQEPATLSGSTLGTTSAKQLQTVN